MKNFDNAKLVIVTKFNMIMTKLIIMTKRKKMDEAKDNIYDNCVADDYYKNEQYDNGDKDDTCDCKYY